MSDTIQPGVHRRIRAAAAHAGLSLQGLADKLAETQPERSGLRAANLKVLGIDRQPRITQLSDIANATGMPLSYLIEGADALRPDVTLAELRALQADITAIVDRFGSPD